MRTTSTDDKSFLEAVKVALKEIVRPWEVLCGLTDIGTAYVPDIYAKTEKDYNDHIGDYMDAPTPIILKETGEVEYRDWDDPDVYSGIETGKYYKVQNKPQYAR